MGRDLKSPFPTQWGRIMDCPQAVDKETRSRLPGRACAAEARRLRRREGASLEG